ncbi:MAG: GAF domain-containing protein, partial [Nitrososphaerales archaeon]
MSFYAISGLINGITSTLVGIYVFTRDIKNRKYQTYGLFCLSLSVWSYGYFFWQVSQNDADALLWSRVLMTGAIFIPVTNFHHIIEFLSWPARKKRWVWLGYVLCLLFLVLNLFSSFFIRGISPRPGFRFWPDPGPAFHAYLLFYFYCVVHFTYLLVRESRIATGIRQNQLRYLIFALGLGYIGGSTNFPLWYGIPVEPYGNLLVSAYILLFSYAVIKFNLLDINIVIKKSLVYAVLLFALLIPCYSLVILGQMAAFGEINYPFSLFTLVLLVVVGFMFPKLRFRMEEAFEQVLFKKRYDHRETLLRSSREMISVVNLETLCQNLVQTVSRALGVGRVSLFLVDEVKGTFGLRASLGLVSDQLKEFTFARDDQLVRRFMRRSEAVVREELAMANNGHGEKELVRRMGEIEAEVSLPLISKESLKGILNLGHKDRRQMYSEEDLEVLSTLANQAAIAIDNAQLYENLKQSQSIIHRANRLSSLGM